MGIKYTWCFWFPVFLKYLFFKSAGQYTTILSRYCYMMLITQGSGLTLKLKSLLWKSSVTLRNRLEMTSGCHSIKNYCIIYYSLLQCKGFSMKIINYNIVQRFNSHLYMVLLYNQIKFFLVSKCMEGPYLILYWNKEGDGIRPFINVSNSEKVVFLIHSLPWINVDIGQAKHQDKHFYVNTETSL